MGKLRTHVTGSVTSAIAFDSKPQKKKKRRGRETLILIGTSQRRKFRTALYEELLKRTVKLCDL